MADGYWFGPPVGTTLAGNDVTLYNAGQFGTANGGPGGTVMVITPDTGLWSVVSGGRLLGGPTTITSSSIRHRPGTARRRFSA